jgi:hypothetical protein
VSVSASWMNAVSRVGTPAAINCDVKVQVPLSAALAVHWFTTYLQSQLPGAVVSEQAPVANVPPHHLN